MFSAFRYWAMWISQQIPKGKRHNQFEDRINYVYVVFYLGIKNIANQQLVLSVLISYSWESIFSISCNLMRMVSFRDRNRSLTRIGIFDIVSGNCFISIFPIFNAHICKDPIYLNLYTGFMKFVERKLSLRNTVFSGHLLWMIYKAILVT